MQFKNNITVLTKTEESYSFEGRNGISRKVRVLMENEIYEIKFKDSEIVIFNSIPPTIHECNMTFNLTSPKEKLLLSIVNINK